MKKKWIGAITLVVGIMWTSGCADRPSEGEAFAVVNVEENEQVFYQPDLCRQRLLPHRKQPSHFLFR